MEVTTCDDTTSEMTEPQATDSSASSNNNLEPEGSTWRNHNMSRRFDEAMLREVTKEDDTQSLDASQLQNTTTTTDTTSTMMTTMTIPEETDCQEMNGINGKNGEQIKTSENNEIAWQLVGSEGSGSTNDKNDVTTLQEQQQGDENLTSIEENGRSSREPPGTPAKREDETKVIPDESIPPLPLRQEPTNGTESPTKYSAESAIDSEILPSPEIPLSHQASSTTNQEEQDEQNKNHDTVVNPPPTLTTHVPGNAVQTVPVASTSLAAPTHLPNMDLNAMSRTSLSSVASNGFHHATNGLVSYSNGEVGIPHLPPLVLPPSANGGYHPHHALAPAPSAGGKRRIHLRLVEDVSKPDDTSLFSSFRKRSLLRKNAMTAPIDEKEPTRLQSQWVDRGSLTLSWYEGTSSLELQEHVRNSVIRKLRLQGTTKLKDFRILDDTVDPPEEIVLCPYIPTGSKLLLRFTTKDAGGEATPNFPRISEYNDGPPESPSAAPSPHPRMVDLGGLGLNANQLALLGARLKGLQMPSPEEKDNSLRLKLMDGNKPLPNVPNFKLEGSSASDKGPKKSDQNNNDSEEENSKEDSNLEVASLHPEDPIQKSLREITELLIAERKANQRYTAPRQEKRQVIFVLANYLVIFISLVAISAEIQARAPTMQAWMERQFNDVQDCSKDKESLIECVEKGDFAGLIASVLLWISRSAATKRIFLFGFESPKKLWTVVYESLVTAVCWGFSYMFIRRGMNPDTNRNFLQKYWKDAVYGSLAGFNAAFMKQVLKNLIPQEAIEDALQDRNLKILSWLPSFS